MAHSAQLNIGILGYGAIGTLWAQRLSRLGEGKVFILATKAPNRRILKHFDESEQELNFDLWPADKTGLDIILITTKSFQALTAFSAWQKCLKPQGQVVIMQNGMGQHQELIKTYPQFNYFAASTTEGAYRENEQVVHAGLGLTQWGILAAKQPLLIDLDKVAGNNRWTDNIEQVLIDKLAINCVINPLTANFRCLNGELLTNSHYNQMFDRLIKEIDHFFHQQGIKLSYQLGEQCYKVAEATGLNRSSMLQDMILKRPSEIDYISGYLLKLTKQSDIDLPISQQLYQLIKQRDQANVRSA